MNNQETIIESITKPETPKKGIKFNGEWHTVIGNAANYVKDLERGPATVGLNEKGDVTFIKQGKSSQDAPSDQNNYYEKGPEVQESTSKNVSGTKHFVMSELSDEELRVALNTASEQNNTIATQTHRENGKWAVVIYIRG